MKEISDKDLFPQTNSCPKLITINYLGRLAYAGRLFYSMSIKLLEEATEVAISIYNNVDLKRNTQSDKIFFTSLGQVLKTLKETLKDARDENTP